MPSFPSHYRAAFSLGGIQFEWLSSNSSGTQHLRVQVFGMPLLDAVGWYVLHDCFAEDWEGTSSTPYYYLPVACELIDYNYGPWMRPSQFKQVDRVTDRAERVLELMGNSTNHIMPGRVSPPQDD